MAKLLKLQKFEINRPIWAVNIERCNNMKYYEINENAAATARSYWSFYDYQSGSKTAEYKKQVDACYSVVEQLPDTLKEKGEAMADRYAKRLADWYNKQFRIEMMCPSVMVSGASNFPVHKKEKQNAAQEKHYQLYNEIQQIPNKIKRMIYGSDIIKSSDENALEQLQAKLEKAEKLQAEMKTVNAYYRKHKTLKGYKDYSDEKAAELDEEIKNSLHKVPFAPYRLTNNNAKIKQVKSRIASIERAKNGANSDFNNYNTDLFKVIENAEIMRLQLVFDGKPDEATRTVLKKYAFKWSPKNNAWQRQLTENAKFALKQVIKELTNIN